MSNIKLEIDGMSCQGCADSLTRRLTSEPGVIDASVSFETKAALIEYESEKLTELDLTKVVGEAGFSGTVSGAPDA